ncbi:MAG: zinc-ribbon domain-containing protein [Pseudomonadota bacterium]
MKIQCPNCNTAYDIDDKMIPDAGIYAICKCEIRFFVKKDFGKKAEEPKILVESKSEGVPKANEAPKMAEKALKAAEGIQNAEEDPDEIKKTLKYMILAVIISYALLFGLYRFYFSPNRISPTQKYLEVIESLKHRF